MSKSNESPKRKRYKRRTRKFRSKIDSFSNGLGLSPIRIVLSLLLLGLIGYFIYWTATSGPKDRSERPVELSKEKTLELELTTDQKLAKLSNAKVSQNENFLITIERMAEFERELEEIEANGEPTESQKLLIDELRLRHKSVTVSLMMSNGVSCDPEKVDLLNFCMARVNSENDEIRESNRFWLCSVPAFEFAFEPSDRTLQGFSRVMKKYPDAYLTSAKRAATIAALVINMAKQGPEKRKFAKKAYLQLADDYAKSELKEVKEMSSKLKELAAFGDFDLQSLEYRIMWSDPSAQGDLDGAFEALSQTPNASSKTWLTIIRAYERFLAVDKIEEAGASWQRMWSYSEQLPDAEEKKSIQSILTRQRTRAMFIGQSFDVSGNSVADSSPIEASHQKYFAVIFCDKGSNSLQSLIRLGRVSKEQQLKYQPVLAFDEKLSEADMSSLHKVPREIDIADDETSQKYFKAFPADFFPYVLLVDKDGKVVAINVDIEQIDSRVAKIEAQERRKLRESAEAQPATAGSQ